jgi:dephospho-CoA kinase
MITIGLTGALGTGKSTVAKMFARRGAHVIDADALVHESLKQGGPCYAKVVRAFGKDILEGRAVSRGKLAQIVFRSASKLKRLTSIIHPIIQKEVQTEIQKLKKNKKARMVVIDAPLLIEAGWHQWVDYLIVVRASTALAVKRVQAKRNMSRAEILRRMKAQMPITQKIRMADIVIDNRKHINETQRQVEKIIQVLKNRI